MDAILSPIIDVLLRFMAYIFVELIFGTICYTLGWFILKLMSLGKYPPTEDFSLGYSSTSSSNICSITGFVVIIAACIWLLHVFG